jgi:hypothetical protein
MSAPGTLTKVGSAGADVIAVDVGFETLQVDLVVNSNVCAVYVVGIAATNIKWDWGYEVRFTSVA